jgi:cell division protein FtsZ
LSGFESARPESASPVDEDLLDIPAFLRRQAN